MRGGGEPHVVIVVRRATGPNILVSHRVPCAMGERDGSQGCAAGRGFAEPAHLSGSAPRILACAACRTTACQIIVCPGGAVPRFPSTHRSCSVWSDPCQGSRRRSGRQLLGALQLQWRLCKRQDRPWGWPPRRRRRSPLPFPRQVVRRTLWQRRRPSRPLSPLARPCRRRRPCCAPAASAPRGEPCSGPWPLSGHPCCRSRGWRHVAPRASMLMLARFCFTLNLASASLR